MPRPDIGDSLREAVGTGSPATPAPGRGRPTASRPTVPRSAYDSETPPSARGAAGRCVGDRDPDLRFWGVHWRVCRTALLVFTRGAACRPRVLAPPSVDRQQRRLGGSAAGVVRQVDPRQPLGLRPQRAAASHRRLHGPLRREPRSPAGGRHREPAGGGQRPDRSPNRGRLASAGCNSSDSKRGAGPSPRRPRATRTRGRPR